MKKGIVHGRFQPVHLGHVEDYFKRALQYCDYLIVGITNPDPEHTKIDLVHPARSLTVNNPFTYYDRYKMVELALLDIGLSSKEFDIVPFPINKPELLKYYVPDDAIHYFNIIEPWGKRKVEILKSQNFKVNVMIDDMNRDLFHATDLRRMLNDGDYENSKNYLTESVFNYIVKHDLYYNRSQ